LKRLDRAFLAFFRRVQDGETPGFPRYKSASRFNSLQWEDRGSWKLKIPERRLYLYGIGDIKANYHRCTEGSPKAITVKREGKKWWVSVRCVDVPAAPLQSSGRSIGIDLGVANLVVTSEGQIFVGEQFGEKLQTKLADAQRKISRSGYGSNRCRKLVLRYAEINRKIVNQRRNSAHKLSRRLVNNFDFIAVENLEISKMVRAPKPIPNPKDLKQFLPNGATRKAQLNKSIYDSGWGTLLSLLFYKAASAGRVVVTVDPRYTSQTCAECEHVEARNRVNRARFRCRLCGHEDHADINAARNILRAGRALQTSVCEGR
jgi:putative transposase